MNDTALVAETGMTGATYNYYTGLHEHNDMGFTLHVLRPGDLFADIGANVGSYSVLASATGAEIVSFEPLPETYSRLLRNMRFNGISAEAHGCGLSSAPGQLQFTVDRDAMNKVVGADYSGLTASASVNTLDNILAGRVPFLIKIDVEGHEPEVLEGGARTLSDPELQAVLMETKRNMPYILERVLSFGFTPHCYDAIERKLAPARETQVNTIFLRDPAMIQERCRSAPRFSLVNGSI